MQKKIDTLFSIIVPVYNTEKYIESCLDSIVQAIDTDCEVIIINDGSTDDSEKIIQKYLKKIPKKLSNKFQYIKKKNKGLADTKNIGILKSKGKYISVVDSDDRIAEDFYSTARKYIDNEDLDIIIYDLYLDFEIDKKLNYTSRAIREDAEGGFINKLMHGAMIGSSCNKIIKKELYKYKFPTGKEYEDVAVTPFILLDAKKIKYIPNPNYIYLQREKSIVSTNTLDEAFYKICRNINDVLLNIKNVDKYMDIINVFYIDRTIDMLDLSLTVSRKDFVSKLEKFYEENEFVIKYIIDSNIISSKKAFLTDRQYKILSKIYNFLFKKEFKKVKRILIFRRSINWLRRMFGYLKLFFKTMFGGIYG